MKGTRPHHAPAAVIVLSTMLLLASCGSDDEPSAINETPPATSDTAVAPDTTAATTTEEPETPTPTSTLPTTTVTDVSIEDWRRQVAALCDPVTAGIGPLLQNDGTPAGATAQVAGLRELLPKGLRVDQLEAPSELVDDLSRVVEISGEADDALAAAEVAAEAEDVEAVDAAIDLYVNQLVRVSAGFILSGARCTDDPARGESADLSVVAGPGAGQLNAGFGSVWVSNRAAGTVDRIDPETGNPIATIDVGPEPLKLQPADGRLWVRTRDAYVAIDPETNTVVASLAKADVGPEANRSWATDGAIWICDGDRVHHYDPTSLEPVATVEVGIECGQVYATPDLVVAWNYNEDPGESDNTTAVMIDPETHELLATVDLPIDVTVPVVLPDALYFAGNQNSSAVVVDRTTWTVTGTHDLGLTVGISQNAYDGERVYVGTYADADAAILIVDPDTYEVVDQIDVLNVNSLDVLDGSLWAVDEDLNILQRFDIAAGPPEPAQ